CAFLGFLVQRIAYKPLFDAPRLSLLITAVGVSLVLSNTVMVQTNSRFLFFTSGLDNTAGIKFGDNITITWIQIVMVLVTAVLMIALTLFIGKTMWGKAMRAISLDKDTCRLMGINVNKIIGLTFVIGSTLAAVAGGMACVYYSNVHYYMGYIIGMKAFTAAVIGGIGSLPGAMLGGLVLGLLEAIGTQRLGSEWKDVFAFGILIIMLIFRPNGLLGKTEIERM
ncbi:MAG: branched-chain amino acid ABC transporter permease, partial [Treponema sp.]|nr:branched-chain amino acid ABC transporter permease [Treponema sp.]